MTNSQKRKVEFIKEKLQNEIEDKNKRFNSNSILIFEEIKENELFVTLKVKYQYDTTKTNIYNDESICLFIFKRGRIEGTNYRFGNDRKIRNIGQVYF